MQEWPWWYSLMNKNSNILLDDLHNDHNNVVNINEEAALFLYNLQFGLKDALVLRKQSMTQSKGRNIRKLSVHQLSLSLNRKLRCLWSLTAWASHPSYPSWTQCCSSWPWNWNAASCCWSLLAVPAGCGAPTFSDLCSSRTCASILEP